MNIHIYIYLYIYIYTYYPGQRIARAAGARHAAGGAGAERLRQVDAPRDCLSV